MTCITIKVNEDIGEITVEGLSTFLGTETYEAVLNKLGYTRDGEQFLSRATGSYYPILEEPISVYDISFADVLKVIQEETKFVVSSKGFDLPVNNEDVILKWTLESPREETAEKQKGSRSEEESLPELVPLEFAGMLLRLEEFTIEDKTPAEGTLEEQAEHHEWENIFKEETSEELSVEHDLVIPLEEVFRDECPAEEDNLVGTAPLETAMERSDLECNLQRALEEAMREPVREEIILEGSDMKDRPVEEKPEGDRPVEENLVQQRDHSGIVEKVLDDCVLG